jgi:O-antigen ligase
VLTLLFISKKDSALGRTTIYKVSSQIISANPLTGVGANRLQIHYNLFQGKYFMEQERPQKTQLIASNTFESFNFLLQIMAEYGFIGLLIVLCFCWSLYKETKATKFEEEYALNKNGIIASLILYFIFCLFSNPFHVTPIFILFIFLLAYLRGNDEYHYFPNSNYQKNIFTWKRNSSCQYLYFLFFWNIDSSIPQND